MNFNSLRQVLALMLIASMVLLSGCASIVSKSRYPIIINSNPTGAKITVKDKKGKEVYAGKTPADIVLKAGAGFLSKASYTVTFDMEGYDQKTVPIETTLDAWYFGNIVFGGLIGILIVDPATGAMWRFKDGYINEKLTKSTASIEDRSLQIYGYQDIPESWKDKLVRIN